jgi:hypothetical protein
LNDPEFVIGLAQPQAGAIGLEFIANCPTDLPHGLSQPVFIFNEGQPHKALAG